MKTKEVPLVNIDTETIKDPEAERSIYEILDTPDEYYEDKKFTRKQEFNKQVREDRKRKTKEQEKHRAKQTIHYAELGRMRRAIGMLDKILILMLQDDRKCRGIVSQLMSASTILRKIAMYVLIRHIDRCLIKKNYKGTNKERIKEMKDTNDLIFKLRTQLDSITKIETYEEEKFDEAMEKMVREMRS